MFKTIRGSATQRARNTLPDPPRTKPDRHKAAPVVRNVSRTIHGTAPVLQNTVPAIHHSAPVICKLSEAQKSDVWRMAEACTVELRKLQFDANFHKNLDKLILRYAINLQEAATAEYLKMDVNAIDGSPLAHAMALAWDLKTFLDWIPRFLNYYHVQNEQTPLEKAISPKHLEFLMKSFRETFAELPEADRRKLVTAIDTEAMDRLGCELTTEERRLQFLSNFWHQKLQWDEVIGKVDYCHVETGHFNAINSALRISSYARIPIASQLVSCVTKPMVSGLKKLMTNEDFVFRGNLFKGIYTKDPAGPFRKSQLIDGNILLAPHAISTTSDPNQSYANPPSYPQLTEHRDTNIVFVGVWGVQVHLFNFIRTVKQKEVLIMPTMAFRGIPKPVDLTEHRVIDRKPTFYCELDPDHSGYVL